MIAVCNINTVSADIYFLKFDHCMVDLHSLLVQIAPRAAESISLLYHKIAEYDGYPLTLTFIHIYLFLYKHICMQ